MVGMMKWGTSMGKATRENRKYPYRKKQGSGIGWIIGLLALGLLAMWGWSEYSRSSAAIPGLESYAEEGREHVDLQASLNYKTDPPTSGPHYPFSTRPAFYTEPQAPGALVHSLEHGQIVIYYDPDKTPAAVVDRLKSYPTQYPGEWDGVVVTPRAQEEEVVLTAWRHALRQKSWDEKVAERFMDAFRGRGPENPVR